MIKNQESLKKFRNLIGSIKYPLVTDKATKLLEQNKYTFIVDKKVNKFTIKKVIEYIFNIKITKINTLNMPKKKSIVGRFLGYKSKYKKAIITLKDGDIITLFPDV